MNHLRQRRRLNRSRLRWSHHPRRPKGSPSLLPGRVLQPPAVVCVQTVSHPHSTCGEADIASQCTRKTSFTTVPQGTKTCRSLPFLPCLPAPVVAQHHKVQGQRGHTDRPANRYTPVASSPEGAVITYVWKDKPFMWLDASMITSPPSPPWPPVARNLWPMPKSVGTRHTTHTTT